MGWHGMVVCVCMYGCVPSLNCQGDTCVTHVGDTCPPEGDHP